MESTNISVRDLNLSPDFWESSRVKLNSQKLDSLDGCPDEVLGAFYCFGNQLVSLAHGPMTVGDTFNCSYNHLTSLVDCPKTVGGIFDCSNNYLTSLAHTPKIVGHYFNCQYNHLTSLIGAPETTGGGGFYCGNNYLTSLVDCPKTVGGIFDCSNNYLTSLTEVHKHLQKMNGTLNIGGNPIISHLLGVLLIQGCWEVNSGYGSIKTSLHSTPLQQAVAILNKYLYRGREGIMDCQAEMLAAGLDDFAQI